MAAPVQAAIPQLWWLLFPMGPEKQATMVTVVDVCKKKIAGCLACEYCHTKGEGRCIQQDDMQEIYPVLEEAEMIVLASPGCGRPGRN